MSINNIELQSFSISPKTTNKESDIEEYHEITSAVNHDESSIAGKCIQLNEFDFFTQKDVKPVKKLGKKKIKSTAKKKGTSTNLMDIVNSELASATVPITENSVISMRDKREEEQSSSLLTLPSIQSLFRKSGRIRLDYENGWRHQESIDLCPIFPRILENVSPHDYSVPVQYVYPVSFEEIAKEQTDHTEGPDKFLDVTIKNIKFQYHYMFSLEKLLCAKLIDYYKTYEDSQKTIKDLSREIKVNRDTRNNVKQELTNISPNKKDDIRFDKTVRKYTRNLIDLKEQYIELLKKQKQRIHKITSLWADIEMVREKSGKVGTPYMLAILTKDFDEKKYDDEWSEAYNAEFNDLLDKIEYEYVSRYIEYKEMKHSQNSDNLDKQKLSKPKLQIDEDALKEEVEKILGGIVSRDQVELILKKDENILTNDTKSGKGRLKYHFDIYVDTAFVCTSEGYACDKDSLFEIDFIESFSVQILQKNKSISIALMENDEEVSLVRINIPKINEIYSNTNFVSYNFIYDNMIIQPTYNYVGSGYSIKEIAKENKVRLKSSNMFEGKLETNCVVTIKTGWNEKLSRNDSESLKVSMEVGRKLARLMHGLDKPNSDTLTDIISQVYGKNIEEDEKLRNCIKSLCHRKIKPDFEFPVNENDPELVRLKLLHLRNMGGFVNVENKTVPIHTTQLSTEHIRCLQKSVEKDVDVEYINDKYTEMDPIEMQRFIGSKYVQKLNQNMLKNLNDHLMKRTHKDVVRDYRELSLRNLFSSQASLITLASMPRRTTQQQLHDLIGKEQEIRVTVLRAYNLLDRSATILTDENDEDDSTIAGFKVRPLRPFIRLSYHGNSTRTATAIGCHPTWNQTVKIHTKLQPLSSLHINFFDEYKANVNEGDSEDEALHSGSMHYRCSSKWLGSLQVPLHTVLTLGTLRGTFKITTPPLVFGYEVLQNKDSTYSIIPEVTRLLKKDISFVSLQITTSLSNLGGSQEYHQPIPSSADDDDLIKHLNNIVTEYTNAFPNRNITLTFIDSSGRNKCVTQYLQPMPLPDYEYFPKNPKVRVESALSKSSGKSSSSKSSGERKKDVDLEKAYQSPREKESIYSGFEGNWKGDSLLVKMMNACLRYVSLIPTYEVTETHVVTLMGMELLKVLHGSPLDHTLLLASYFLQLGIKCWVVIGNGLPRGLSSYVLTKYDLTSRRDVLVTDQLFKNKGFLNKADGYLWNVHDATTGERYDLRDVTCPLKTVNYIFDDENIWLNMQSTQDCESVSFDLTKSSNWMAVFDKRNFMMKQPLVTDANLYDSPPDVSALREMLESKIKIKVQKWRSHLKTIWNRYCSSLLREVLPHWEYWTFNPTESKPVLSQRLKQLMITYKLFGFPLNMPYVNAKSVITTVKSTGLHVNDDPNVEFGLAVEVYAYPKNVLSVWVFLASITRI